MNATIKDIAKIANVSTATVSRVLNNAGGYNETTRKKIMDIANKLGYRRNEMARSLVQNSSNIIGVIMPNAATIFYADIVNGIESMAHTNGYSVILSHSGVNGNRFNECMDIMAARKVDGLVIVTVELNTEQVKLAESLNIPFILLSTDTPDNEAPYIKVNDFDAAYAATEFLIINGHTKIGLAGVDPNDRVAGMPRIEGYKKALEDNRIKFHSYMVKFGDFSFYAGKEAMKEYLKENILVTAVFGVSDDVALGIISAAYDHDLKVPEDLSVIGYDNTRVAEMSIPPLTSISQPFLEMGEEGCQRVIEAIHSKKGISSKIISYSLEIRESVKKIM
ncbi:LacI family DNA-binding transcriptional regulator [Niallia sp. NCCP-28]|uniref:LacI family DNA-binding transcriptional regulator n=1 Tax=Niallia sp. NCCP-28 TaxID=2934712 RepID=UPI00207F1B05|nr:LacI family DNA-binding transcriptional regulator [Niallia sp. NCCP-28]GKU83513.1 catabolite control protein A [Niallia sp. NCCP-28]